MKIAALVLVLIQCNLLRAEVIDATLPDDRYTVLDPISLRFLKDDTESRKELVLSILRIIERSKDDPDEIQRIVDQYRNLITDQNRSGEMIADKFSGLERILKESGGQLHYFVFRQDNFEDIGFCIVKDGVITHRWPEASGIDRLDDGFEELPDVLPNTELP